MMAKWYLMMLYDGWLRHLRLPPAQQERLPVTLVAYNAAISASLGSEQVGSDGISHGRDGAGVGRAMLNDIH